MKSEVNQNSQTNIYSSSKQNSLGVGTKHKIYHTKWKQVNNYTTNEVVQGFGLFV
jgi:tryptophan synthase alpha subunit